MPSLFKVVNITISPCGGGAEYLVRELYFRMKKRGLKVENWYFNNPTSCNSLGEDDYILNCNTKDPRIIYKLRCRIKDMLRDNSDDFILHVHLTWPFFFVAIASWGLPISLVYTEHNSYNRRRKFRLFYIIERFFYSRYDRIICISQGVKEALVAWIGSNFLSKVVVISNGSRIFPLAERGCNKFPVKFISVGSLTKKKNFFTTINTLSKLTIPWMYTIVGDGPERLNLERLVKNLNLTERVIFAGWSNNVNVFYNNSDIQLIPSLWEGFGLVAVEGMSTGLPIVASKVTGLQEVLDPSNPAVFLVGDFTDPSQWLEKINECIKQLKINPVKLSIAAHNQSKLFSLDGMVTSYIKEYENLNASRNNS
jgi:glycosyltransferase involved in cell wall biosynthesis